MLAATLGDTDALIIPLGDAVFAALGDAEALAHRVSLVGVHAAATPPGQAVQSAHPLAPAAAE